MRRWNHRSDLVLAPWVWRGLLGYKFVESLVREAHEYAKRK